MTSDEGLYMQYMNQKDDAAAQALVEKYGDSLTLYLTGFLHDIQEAEDLMIEAFSLMFVKKRPIDGEGSFRAYLYQVGRNLAIRHHRKHPLALIRIPDLNFEISSENLAETSLIHSERSRMLYAAMEKMKEDYREALYLVYFEEMSYRDTAAVMKKTVEQVTKLVHRGKQQLRKLLEEEGYSDEND